MGALTVTMSYSTSPLFGPVVPEIGWAPPLRYLLRRNRVLKLLAPLPMEALLEVGCGSGALLHELARFAQQAVGLETSEPAVRMAREIARLGGGRQEVVDMPSALWSGHFDLVCAFDVLEHIEQDTTAVDQWLGWLRPGGRLCISVPAHGARWGAGDVWAGHYRRYERAGLQELLRSKGMRIEHFECYGFPLANLTEAMGNRVERIVDAGVAGLHRILSRLETIQRANVVIVVAGMEGALPSVVAGLVSKPVIAVPTSVGYGASFGGVAALLGMLNSCGSGVTVVNIDNGFGAGYAASQINALASPS